MSPSEGENLDATKAEKYFRCLRWYSSHHHRMKQKQAAIKHQTIQGIIRRYCTAASEGPGLT